MTVCTAPAVTAEVFLKHQLLHPCCIHRGQRVLLTQDREAPMARTIQEYLHRGLLLSPLVAVDGFLGHGENTSPIVMPIEAEGVNNLLLHGGGQPPAKSSPH